MRTEARGGLALADGSFKFPLGVKCWPRKTNVRMWRGWDEGGRTGHKSREVHRGEGGEAVRWTRTS